MRWILSILPLFFISGALAFYTPDDEVVELTDANFDSKVMKSVRIWIVEFYAPYCGHCKNLVPEYKKAAKLLKGIAAVGAIDATTQQQIPGKYAIKGYPTIKIFGATDKNKPIDYNGPRTAKGIADAVRKSIEKTLEKRLKGEEKTEKSQKSGQKSDKNEKNKGKNGKKQGKGGGEVIVLTDSNFEKLVLNSKDAWMVEFFAPWCGHCQKLEPEWKKASKEMGGRVKFGALDATAHERMARKFGIQGFPTIKFFAPGSSASDAEDYQGPRRASDLVSYSESKFEDVASPPEVIEAIGKEVIEEECNNSKQLCIFTFLPNIYDCQSECRRQKIDILNELASIFKKRAWGWLWIEAGAQANIEKAFEIGDSGYPVLVAMSPTKMKYSTQIGQFSIAGIKEFLNSVNYGKGRVTSIQPAHLSNNFLKIAEIQRWDGKDKELPIMEEIDLSDVDLDEKSEL